MKKNKFIADIAIVLAVILTFGITACKEPTDNERAELTGSVTTDIDVTGINAGTVPFGATITANTAALEGSGKLTYQWQTSNALNGSFINIENATESSYLVKHDDNDDDNVVKTNRYLRVTVTRADYRGSKSSAAVRIVRSTIALPGEVTIPSAIALGGTLTADISKLGGSGPVTYQWQTGSTKTGSFTNIQENASSINFKVEGADVNEGSYIRVRVTRPSNPGNQTSEAFEIKDPNPLTGSVTIPSEIRLGTTITASYSNLSGSGQINYQWQISNTNDGPFTNRGFASTSDDFQVTDDYPVFTAGSFLRVSVTRSDRGGSIESDAVKILASSAALTGTVTIPNSAAINATITAVTGNNLSGSGQISYQWQISDTANGTFTNIGSVGTSNSFKVEGSTVTEGRYLKVLVTRPSNAAGVSSNAAQITAPGTPLSGSVTIPSTIRVSDSVYVNINSLGGTGEISYQWQIGNSESGPFDNIGQATTSNRFTVAGENVTQNRYLRVSVTRSNNSSSRESNAVKLDPPPPRAYIDFSGYTGSAGNFNSDQPSSANPGDFNLLNGIVGSGLRLNNNAEGTVAINQYGGQWATRTSDGSGFQFFYIDNPTIKAADTVTLVITFYDDATGDFSIDYVRKTGNNSTFYGRSIPRSNSGEYVTVKIELDQCRFNSGDQQHAGTQFRITGSQPIQRVELVEGGMGDPVTDQPPPQFAAFTTDNDMIGKGIFGYQAWFNAPGNNWHHWGSGKPGPGNVNVELWPTGMEEYQIAGATLHNTDFTLPAGINGTPVQRNAQLYNSHDKGVIWTHLKWMQEAGVDGLAPQRFFESTSTVDTGNARNHLVTIKEAAEEYGRIFYVMYDMSAAGRPQYNETPGQALQRVQRDWIYNVENKGIVSSSSYAQAEGKPVVCIWGVHGIESTDDYRYIKVEDTINLIKWFRNRGYYVIGGVPDDAWWERTGRAREMYTLFDMISPWYVGRSTDYILSTRMNLELTFCASNTRSWAGSQPIAFMPVICPGGAWTNMPANNGAPNADPRNGGQKVWKQVRGYLNISPGVIKNLYFAMLDEYDEGTNWIKGGVDYFDIPLNQYFMTHSADGLWVSSDYYLRLVKAAGDALKNGGAVGPLNDYSNGSSIIVEHSNGPVFWRNSFERRTGRLGYGASGEGHNPTYTPVRHIEIDVGVPNGSTISNTNVTVTGSFTTNRPRNSDGLILNWNATVDTYNPPSTTLGMVYSTSAGGSYSARSGDSAFRLAGNKTSTGNAEYIYKIANTRIKASSRTTLTVWQKADDTLGASVIVDLKNDSGAYLSSTAAVTNTGSPSNGWQKKTVTIPWNSGYITEVFIIFKDNSGASGSFAALIDDIMIANN